MPKTSAEYNRSIRARCKENGWCHRCGLRRQEPVAPGKVMCEKHLEMSRKEAKPHVWRRMGINATAAQARLDFHDGRCECCGASESGARGWHVDHCHDTGRIRGIICGKCNLGLGLLGDNLTGLQKALKYLERYADKTLKENA